MTAREKFIINEFVRSTPDDPRGPRTGVVVGFTLHPGDIEVYVHGASDREDRVTMTHMDWWKPTGRVVNGSCGMDRRTPRTP